MQIVRGSNLPVPIAVGIAVILGFLSLVKTKRPIYYTVEEGDDLCTIGECFNQDYQRVFEKNRSIITNPNLIYPGDRYHQLVDGMDWICAYPLTIRSATHVCRLRIQ